MSVQQFCLRWNNHQPNFISVFSTLLHNETLVDVTLAAEGRQLQAHKVVLSACSSYFQTLFTTNPCQHPIVILKDVQYNHLKTMVDFMYYGEVNVSQEQLPHILKTAEMLKIKGLAEMPDATSLTKSESKSSSSDHIEQIANMASDSIWGSTESQHFHHQQQQRRTPSPVSVSPSNARRKRLRKNSIGSGSASTERISEEQSNVDVSSNINLAHIDQMSSFGSTHGNQGNISQHINSSRMLKESSSTETDNPHQESSQESIDESMHHSSVMKTDDDIANVSQSMPLDITGSSSSAGQTPTLSCSQPQPGVQWTLIDSNYSRFALSSYQTSMGIQTPAGHNSEIHQSNQNSNNSTNSNNNNNNNNSGNNPSNQSNHESVQQMQYQQQGSSSYSPQIISVNPNNLMNSYHSGLSTPPSPSQENDSMVQSVYSQGPTPSQSPIPQMSGISNSSIGSGNGGNGGNGASQLVPLKRKRSVNPQGDENFIRALDAVRYGGIGFCKAARLYGVNNRTLWLEYKKRGYPISRPSIKNRIKLEPNVTPPPLSPSQTNEENTMENYDHLTPTAINMATVSASSESTSTPIMCPPHPMGVMSFLDTRHVDFPAALHPMSRQRYTDPSINVNPAINLQGLNFNSM